MKPIIIIILILLFFGIVDSQQRGIRKSLPYGVPIKSGITTNFNLNPTGSFYMINGYNMTEYPCSLMVNNVSVGVVNAFSYYAAKYSTTVSGTQLSLQPQSFDPFDMYKDSIHLMLQTGIPTNLNNSKQLGPQNPSYTYHFTDFNDYFFVLKPAGSASLKITITENRLGVMNVLTTFNTNITQETVLSYFLDDSSTLDYKIEAISGSVTVDVFTY